MGNWKQNRQRKLSKEEQINGHRKVFLDCGEYMDDIL